MRAVADLICKDPTKLRRLREEVEKEGVSRSIAVNYGLSSSSLNRLASRQGWNFPKRGTNSAKADFFRTWSPEMAWLLGYTWADGCIYRQKLGLKRKTPSCLLQYACKEEDRELVDLARSLLESKHTVSNYVDAEGHSSVKIGIVSTQLVEDLEKLGIRERKSYLNLPFNPPPRQFLSDFVRGYLEGDGVINLGNQDKARNRVLLLGTYSWVTGLQSHLSLELGIKINKPLPKKGKNTWTVEWASREDVFRLLTFLYPSSALIGLKRKAQRAQQLLASLS